MPLRENRDGDGTNDKDAKSKKSRKGRDEDVSELACKLKRHGALDEALICPGYVDLQISFTNAMQEQARELFRQQQQQQQFAAKIPAGQFSPAELQGFLLKRKKTPWRALAEVEGWVAGMVAQKAKRGRVLAVQ
ncbi:uncharacterized protein B0T15DRAFT_495219 [Chaetomium strumarium]|uniref:Mitochondrial chaperone BCS1-like ATPase lid domain-containing protein n=1 Tax=Chaetomium strumarium TaxID=1170767 RepID=A0AAJ0GRK1_9PEZI|nr:hypothetical protein B0T15DRAFT_495219 [Chaetomium strumarium]